MGYTIELSYNLLKVEGDILARIQTLAHEYQCLSCYEDYEMSGNTKHEKRNCVVTINFEEYSLNECSKFVYHLRQIKHVKVETFYTTDNSKLLFASSGYLKTISHDQSNTYSQNKERRERSYSEGELLVVNQLRKDKRRSGTMVDENTLRSFSSTETNPRAPPT